MGFYWASTFDVTGRQSGMTCFAVSADDAQEYVYGEIADDGFEPLDEEQIDDVCCKFLDGDYDAGMFTEKALEYMLSL